MIVELLKNKTIKEKADIKSAEIIKLPLQERYTNSKYGVDVHILEVKKIDSGIECFVKGWKNGKQLGFGNGTVEIERIKMYNPPILFPDGTKRKKLTREGDYIEIDNFKEDPIAAVRETLAHTVRVIGKENSNIVSGKISNTTSTFFPVAGANSPVDGLARREGCAAWTTARTGAGDSVDNTDITITAIINNAACASDNWGANWERPFTLFDTSTIGTDSISSATWSGYVTTVNDAFGGMSWTPVTTNPASNAAIAAGDYYRNSLPWGGGTKISATEKTLAGQGTGAYSDFTLNATGLSNISKTGITKFGFGLVSDINDVAPTWSTSFARVICSSADEAGTAQDPKLVVVHTAAGGGSLLTLMGVG